MGISLKEVALLLQQMSRLQYRHWVCPSWHSQSSTEPSHPLPFRTATAINILNLNPTAVEVQVNLFDNDGNLVPHLEQLNLQKTTVPARGRVRLVPTLSDASFTPGEGWIEITCTKPIYPSGHVSTTGILQRPGPFNTGETFPASRVFPLVFYPVFEPEDVAES